MPHAGVGATINSVKTDSLLLISRRKRVVQGVVTLAQPGKPCDLSWIAHLGLLARYVFSGRPDVHSGYFEPGFVGGLIYRFACISYGDSEVAYGKFDGFSTACKEHQVKTMRS